ncbi:MAG TPA: DUF3560 domain-containing protein [Gemmatimonadales bacterium]|nr:DUF3560 domain-containing protein [Gemmatimonadales bacterium]
MNGTDPPDNNPNPSKATFLRDRLTRRPWLHFPRKPDDATLAALRAAGWRWGSYRQAWFHSSPLAVPPPSIPFEDGGECDYAAERADRLEARAGRAADQAAAHRSAGAAIADAIPFGQPILVGHHSERRHRRDLQRLDQHQAKAYEQTEAAITLRRAADASRSHQKHLEDTGTIYRRLDRLRAELRKLERHPWSEAHSAEYQRRLSQLRAEIQRNEALLAAAEPHPSTTLDVRPGDLVRIKGWLVRVARVNTKTISGTIAEGGAAGMTGKWDKSWLQAIVQRGDGSP